CSARSPASRAGPVRPSPGAGGPRRCATTSTRSGRRSLARRSISAGWTPRSGPRHRSRRGPTPERPRRRPGGSHAATRSTTARRRRPRLPRAGEQRAGAAGDGRSERPRGEIRPVRLERDRDRPASTAATGRRRSAGPPALPLIVLIGVVVVLLVGVVWLVVTG